MNLDRWRSLMARLGIDENRATYDALARAHAEGHRFYHTGDHVAYCLDRLEEAADLAGSLEEVELALWFHDAVYVPGSADNERRSADWAASFLGEAGVAAERCARVRDHVLSTRHETTPEDPDAALVVDVDLAILGSAPADYGRFEANIRREYRAVPPAEYRRKRREVLRSFVGRPRIYGTDYFHRRYQKRAEANLYAALRDLTD